LLELSVNFQFLQKTHLKYPRPGADHWFNIIESYLNHVPRQHSEPCLCQTITMNVQAKPTKDCQDKHYT